MLLTCQLQATGSATNFKFVFPRPSRILAVHIMTWVDFVTSSAGNGAYHNAQVGVPSTVQSVGDVALNNIYAFQVTFYSQITAAGAFIASRGDRWVMSEHVEAGTVIYASILNTSNTIGTSRFQIFYI